MTKWDQARADIAVLDAALRGRTTEEAAWSRTKAWILSAHELLLDVNHQMRTDADLVAFTGAGIYERLGDDTAALCAETIGNEVLPVLSVKEDRS